MSSQLDPQCLSKIQRWRHLLQRLSYIPQVEAIFIASEPSHPVLFLTSFLPLIHQNMDATVLISENLQERIFLVIPFAIHWARARYNDSPLSSWCCWHLLLEFRWFSIGWRWRFSFWSDLVRGISTSRQLRDPERAVQGTCD